MAKHVKEPPKRTKPKVAFVNAESASNNIEIKQHALEYYYQLLAPSGPRAVTKIDVTSLRGALPTSLRQFNFWDSALLPPNLASMVPKFTRNAPATLRSSPIRQASVQKLVSSVKAFFASDLDRPEPARFASLRRAKNLAVTLREIAEQALKEEMRRSISLQSEVDLLKKSLSSLARESQEALKARDEIIAKFMNTQPDSKSDTSVSLFRK